MQNEDVFKFVKPRRIIVVPIDNSNRLIFEGVDALHTNPIVHQLFKDGKLLAVVPTTMVLQIQFMI